ncbi:ABC transporter substrate-binding protein [Catenulispora pinisilvae]|uniref:ABC transporter substrate-binding protein n=1 Tax=Catenulispora pinisilvae TaxID=2705253 RepID=UPI001E2832B0|nr:sugar ABC transporter substrate-binding protein [Catenulispora pinisilvae]
MPQPSDQHRMKGRVRSARPAVAAAVAAGLVLAATGCGSGSGSGSGSKASGGPVNLTYRIWDSTQQTGMQHIVDAFQQANPNIHVRIELVANKEYWTKLQADATAGSAPDVFWMNGPNAQLYESNKQLLALSSNVLKQNGVDLANYPAALNQLYNLGGTQYGIPKDFDTVGLWYNKKLFDAAGLKYPDASWTWQDVQNAAKKLTDASKGQYGILAPPYGQENYYDTIFQAGGYVIAPDGKSSGYAKPEAQAGLKFWSDLVKDGYSPSLKSMTDTFAAQQFESGKIGMYYAGSWNCMEFSKSDTIKDSVDVAVLPQGVKKATVIHGLANVGYAKTKHPAEVEKFLAFLGSKQANEIEAKDSGVIPAYNGTQQAWVASFPNFHVQSYLDELPYAVAYPTSKNTSAWQNQEAAVLAPAWDGGEDIGTAAQQLATMMNTALSKEQ